MRKSAVFGVVVAILAITAGCGSSGSKVGAKTPARQTLTFEVSDDTDFAATQFAIAVSDHTAGHLRVRHDLTSPYTSAVPANELRLVHALEDGTVEVGYVPARAWAAEGIADFQALLAPFVLTTQEASLALVKSPVAQSVLDSLPDSVVGLGLVPQEPRRILATRPPTSANALRGLRIRVIDNQQTIAMFKAVGAEPVDGIDAHVTGSRLQEHTLDGVESNTSSILANGYQTTAHYFSTYSPFAKFQTIVVSRKTWDTLTSTQQAALRTAAKDAVSFAVTSIPYQEQQELTNLCEAAARPARPTRAQLDQIAAAMRATTPQVITTSSTEGLLAQLLALPGTGPRVLATPLPPECLHAPKLTPFVHRGGPTIPIGVYTVTDTYGDWLKGNVINPDFLTAITYVTTFKEDGTWFQTSKPNYPDQGPFRGTYRVHGDQVTFVMTCAGKHCQNGVAAPETVNWSYFDGRLTFRNLVVADPASRVLYEAHAWRKIR